MLFTFKWWMSYKNSGFSGTKSGRMFSENPLRFRLSKISERFWNRNHMKFSKTKPMKLLRKVLRVGNRKLLKFSEIETNERFWNRTNENFEKRNHEWIRKNENKNQWNLRTEKQWNFWGVAKSKSMGIEKQRNFWVKK